MLKPVISPRSGIGLRIAPDRHRRSPPLSAPVTPSLDRGSAKLSYVADAGTRHACADRHRHRHRHINRRSGETSVTASSKTPLLDKIRTPDDLRRLQEKDLAQVAHELRLETVDAVSVTGGHLGAGLGVIELTVALHWVFDTPRDRLIWDVGHQAYPHKIITGRRDRIRTLRQGGRAVRLHKARARASTTRSAPRTPRHRSRPASAWRSRAISTAATTTSCA